MTGKSVSVTVGLLFIAFGAGWYVLEFERSVREKAVYGALQGIERDYREKKISTPMLVTNGGDAGEVLGLHIADPRFPYAWVSLDHLGRSGQLLIVPEAANVEDRCISLKLAMDRAKPSTEVRMLINRMCRP